MVGNLFQNKKGATVVAPVSIVTLLHGFCVNNDIVFCFFFFD